MLGKTELAGMYHEYGRNGLSSCVAALIWLTEGAHFDAYGPGMAHYISKLQLLNSC